MRIGAHVGQVIAGITGTNLVRYDIYGPDVLIANKMESEGVIGRINVSDKVREISEELHPELFEFEDNVLITAKAVNREHMSYLISRRN